MRKSRIQASIFILCAALAVFAGAAPATAQAPPGESAQTRIEIDEESGAIRFIVKDIEIAIIDETGLHRR
jgi:hypothetical protein